MSDKVRSLTRRLSASNQEDHHFHSASSLIAAELGSKVDTGMMAPGDRTCHGCHGPIDADHQGIKSGADSCTLSHYPGCEGGVLGGIVKGQKWRPCPETASGGETDTEGVEPANEEDEDLQMKMDHLTLETEGATMVDKFDADDEGDFKAELEKQEDSCSREVGIACFFERQQQAKLSEQSRFVPRLEIISHPGSFRISTTIRQKQGVQGGKIHLRQ